MILCLLELTFQQTADDDDDVEEGDSDDSSDSDAGDDLGRPEKKNKGKGSRSTSSARKVCGRHVCAAAGGTFGLSL